MNAVTRNVGFLHRFARNTCAVIASVSEADTLLANDRPIWRNYLMPAWNKIKEAIDYIQAAIFGVEKPDLWQPTESKTTQAKSILERHQEAIQRIKESTSEDQREPGGPGSKSKQ